VVFRPCLLAFILAFSSIGFSDELNTEESPALQGGLSTNYRIRMNQNTEVFVKNCDNPTPPIFDSEKWCSIPTGWSTNPGDGQNGRTATEIWQATGRCAKGHKFNALKNNCVPSNQAACTWGQKLNSSDATCESMNAEETLSPKCEIKGFNTGENGSGLWLNKTIPSTNKVIYAYVSCHTQEEKSFIPICNLKNLSNNKQTNWYKCLGPEALTQHSHWIELNLSEVSKDNQDNQILFEIRGAYSKTPLSFHESDSKTFIYKN
jgi:hypothetical protein